MSTEVKPFKLVVLISGEGSNLKAIIDAIAAKSLHAHIALVISHRATANGLNHARNANIPFIILRPKKGQTRAQYDQKLIDEIMPLQVDLIILAGFMRILSSEFIQKFKGKTINIHPSLLPQYKGLDTHQRVIDADEKFHGASVHYVTEDLDAGKIILQSRIQILAEDTATSLKQRIHQEEHIIYPRAIEWLRTQANR
ncbi:MAG: phosphoribosylglycinamide formyltransferase [Arenicellales bacterium]